MVEVNDPSDFLEEAENEAEDLGAFGDAEAEELLPEEADRGEPNEFTKDIKADVRRSINTKTYKPRQQLKANVYGKGQKYFEDHAAKTGSKTSKWAAEKLEKRVATATAKKVAREEAEALIRQRVSAALAKVVGEKTMETAAAETTVNIVAELFGESMLDIETGGTWLLVRIIALIVILVVIGLIILLFAVLGVIFIITMALGGSTMSSTPGTGGGCSVAGTDIIRTASGDLRPIGVKEGYLTWEAHMTAVSGPHYVGPDSKDFSNGGTTSQIEDGHNAFSPHTTDQEHWYVNSRWFYPLSTSAVPGAYWGEIAHKKVVLTSRKTGKVVIASIEEYGPALDLYESQNRKFGAPPEVFAALGLTYSDANSSSATVTGEIAVDQTMPLGPVTCGGGIPGGAGAIGLMAKACEYIRNDALYRREMVKDWTDCWGFVATSLIHSTDRDYTDYWVRAHEAPASLDSHNSIKHGGTKYQVLDFNTAILKPGDMLFRTVGGSHAGLYIGKNYCGCGTKTTLQASLGGHGPQCDGLSGHGWTKIVRVLN